MEDAVAVADIDKAVPHADRCFEGGGLVIPFFFAGGQVQGIEVLVVRANVNYVAGDGRCAFAAIGSIPSSDRVAASASSAQQQSSSGLVNA